MWLVFLLATLLPVPVWLYFKDKKQLTFKWLLSFSGAFLLGVMFIKLMPAFYSEPNQWIPLTVMLGFFLQLSVEHITKGIEHGHVHLHPSKKSHFPLPFFLALYFHAFTEALPLSANEHHHFLFDIHVFAWGIIIHKWPVVIALLTLLYKAGVSVKKSIFMVALFASAMPLAELVGPTLLNQFNDPGFVLQCVLGVSIGILLHVSTTILFETEEGHKLHWKKILVVLLGFLLPIFL